MIFIDDQILINGTKNSAAFTATNVGDLFTSAAHGLSNGDILTFTTTGSLPAGTAINTWYYVIGATTNTFQVSLTPGGTAVVLTGDSSATCTYYKEAMNMIDVSNFEYVTVTLNTVGSTTAVVRFATAVTKTLPDFSQPQSTTNPWDHIGFYDMDTFTSNVPNGVSGATGITFSGTDGQRVIRFDVYGLKWFGVITQTWSAGTIVCKGRASSHA
jgi:hypothetical protein